MSPQRPPDIRTFEWEQPIANGALKHSESVAHPFFLRALVVAFVAATFLENFVLWDVPFLYSTASIIGVVLAGVYAIAVRRIRFFHPAGFFLVFVLVTAAVEVRGDFLDRSSELSFYLQYVQVFILYLIVLDIARDRRLIAPLALTFLFSAMVMSILANLGFINTEFEQTTGRVGVAGLNLNNQAFIYAICGVGAIVWILRRWPKFGLPELGLIALTAPCIIALARTGSRGGALVLLFGIGVALLLHVSPGRIGAYMLIVPVMIAGIWMVLVNADVLQSRVASTLEEGDTGLRQELLWMSLGMITERPWTGWGASYPLELGLRMDRSGGLPIATHNTYTEMLVAFGVVGFIPWVLGTLASVWAAWRCRRDMWGSIFVTLLLMTLVDAVSGNFGTSKFFWVLLALIGGLRAAVFPSRAQLAR